MRHNVPVYQNIVIRTRAEAEAVPRERLRLMVCGECGFIYNQAFQLGETNYGDSYDNDQTCSPLFRKHVDDLVDYLVDKKNVKDCKILEIGCGQGSFLRKIIQKNEARNTGYGLDPAYNGPGVELDGRLTFSKTFYGSNTNIQADVVICRHVIEHVPDPVGFLREVRLSVGNSRRARLFIETPCVEWILRNKVLSDFFYEHCSYFCGASLSTACNLSGFTVENIQHVFGSQYLWIEARLSLKGGNTKRQAGVIPVIAREYADKIEITTNNWRQRIERLTHRGRIALWGGGAKGVTFANLVDPQRHLLDCVIDLNPRKQGCYLPGTGHRIVNYRDVTERMIRFAVLMNPNYYKENRALLRQHHLHVHLLKV